MNINFLLGHGQPIVGVEDLKFIEKAKEDFLKMENDGIIFNNFVSYMSPYEILDGEYGKNSCHFYIRKDLDSNELVEIYRMSIEKLNKENNGIDFDIFSLEYRYPLDEANFDTSKTLKYLGEKDMYGNFSI